MFDSAVGLLRRDAPGRVAGLQGEMPPHNQHSINFISLKTRIGSHKALHHHKCAVFPPECVTGFNVSIFTFSFYYSSHLFISNIKKTNGFIFIFWIAIILKEN